MNHFAKTISVKTVWALRMLAKVQKLGANGYQETWPEAVGTLLATVEGLIDGISEAAGDNELTDLILSTLATDHKAALAVARAEAAAVEAEAAEARATSSLECDDCRVASLNDTADWLNYCPVHDDDGTLPAPGFPSKKGG